jgi:hypothetical protein
MASFQLKQGGTTFDCDPFGKVSVSGSAAGTWTTNKQNQIEITRPDGTTVANDVGWQFDSDNHLVLFSGGEQIFDFHEVPGNRPLCGTVNAVLMVRPDRSNAFTFQLRGDWSLDDGHDLNFTVNGVKSVIDGFIDDPRGRFMYHFRSSVSSADGSRTPRRRPRVSWSWTSSTSAKTAPRRPSRCRRA